MTQFGIVYVTVPDEETGAAIARAVVEAKLAACANLFPAVRSFYVWEGAVQDEQEHVLILKTRSDRFEALRQRIRSLHPYEVPCIVAVPLVDGDPEYLAWLEASLDA